MTAASWGGAAPRLHHAVLQPVIARTTAAAVLAAVPTAVVAFVVYRALAGTTRGPDLAGSAAIVAVALLSRIGLARAAGARLRRALNAAAERVRIEVVEGLCRLPPRRFAQLDAGRVVAILTTGIDEAVAVFGDAFDAIFGSISTALSILVMLVVIDWRIALVAAAFAPLTAGYLWQSRKISARAAPRLVRARAEGASRFFEYVESVALLRTFGRSAERAQRLAWALQELKIKAFETSIAPIPFGVLALFFIEFGFAISVMVGTEVNAGAGFAAARFLLGMLVALSYFQTLFDATDGYLRLRDARSAWTGVEQLLERTAPAGRGPEVPTGCDVALEDVRFGYDRGLVLNGISCRLESGGVTAIVGRSGAGKSALANIIAGLTEPANGCVRIGGVDVAGLPAAERARLVALVFQDTELLDGTLAHNIAAGRPGASEAEIQAAARTAGCDEFIARLPARYETVVRSAAPQLSLGERQRIAIARALIGGAPIVVFDECTASLDPAAERVVHAAIEALAERATVVLITHRLGSVRSAQRIIVLAGGRIVQTGTHAALAGVPGEYARLWAAYDAAHLWRMAR